MEKETKKMTICFLLKQNGNEKLCVCLGEKKRGYRKGKLNGCGGKIEIGETPEACIIRESYEEFGVNLNSVRKSGEVVYEDVDKIHHCYIFTSDSWTGTPEETDEMKPDWYDTKNIPFERMGKTDHFWIGEVLKGRSVRAKFNFDSKGKTLSKIIEFK